MDETLLLSQYRTAPRIPLAPLRPNPQSAFTFFSCFVATIRREWFGIDRLRLDKFLLLIRRFVRRMLECLAKAKWWAPPLVYSPYRSF